MSNKKIKEVSPKECPTAEEILEKNVNEHRIASKTDPTNVKRAKEEVFCKSMIEFAKLHVEALKTALEDAPYEDMKVILNSYTLENIK